MDKQTQPAIFNYCPAVVNMWDHRGHESSEDILMCSSEYFIHVICEKFTRSVHQLVQQLRGQAPHIQLMADEKVD